MTDGANASVEPPVVCITGASTGIGLALVKRLLQGSWRVVATARASSIGRFAEAGVIEGPNCMIRPLALPNGQQAAAVIKEVHEVWGGVDMLVNNAGVSYRAVLEHVEPEDERAQFDINYSAAMMMSRLVLPGMRERRRGRIINVSSVGGMMAMPTMSVYSASKFALEGASEGLWYELKPWNIKVTVIQPGFIRSDGFEKVRLTACSENSLTNSNAPYHAHYQNMSGFIRKMMMGSPATPDTVAKVIERTMTRRSPPLRASGTLDARLFGMLWRLLPRRVYHAFLYRMLPGISEWGEPALKSKDK